SAAARRPAVARRPASGRPATPGSPEATPGGAKCRASVTAACDTVWRRKCPAGKELTQSAGRSVECHMGSVFWEAGLGAGQPSGKKKGPLVTLDTVPLLLRKYHSPKHL